MGVIDWLIKLVWEPDICCTTRSQQAGLETVTGLTILRRFRIRTKNARC